MQARQLGGPIPGVILRSSLGTSFFSSIEVRSTPLTRDIDRAILSARTPSVSSGSACVKQRHRLAGCAEGATCGFGMTRVVWQSK